MNRPELKYQPQVFENGWYCACGAFHPKEEDTVYCSECGCDRILLQNALNTLPDTLAEVNLSAQNVTVWTKADADEEVIRKAIRDAGYLPLRTKEKV